jgi:hypothetical protein
LSVMSSSDPATDAPTSGVERLDHEPPLQPEVLVALVQALGGLTSESPEQRRFAEHLRQECFEELPKKYTGDLCASAYLREVLIAVASAVRGCAVERTAFRRARAREERLDEIRARLTEPKFFHSPIESQRWGKFYALAAKLLLPVAGTAALLRVWQQLPWWGVLIAVALAGIWLFVGDLLLALVTVRLQLRAFRGAGDVQSDVRNVWATSLPTYKELAIQLLVFADRCRERWYPASTGLLAPLRWRDVGPSDLRDFLVQPHTQLGNRAPAEVLSHHVDLHFGIRSEHPLYVAQRSGHPSQTSPRPAASTPVGIDAPRLPENERSRAASPAK